MKIGVRAGHNVYNNGVFDVGAVGVNCTEAKFVKDTVAEIKRKVSGVVDITPYNERFRRAKDHHREMHRRAESLGVDLIVDIHMNSSKSGLGNGVECFVFPGSVSRRYAESICTELSKYGLRNRGVKEHKSFWTLTLGKTPAIIVEGGFINNGGDMSKLTPKRYADAIIRALGLKVKNGNKQRSNSEVIKGNKVLVNGEDLGFDTYLYKGENYIRVKELGKIGYNVRYKKGVVDVIDVPGSEVIVDGDELGRLGVLRRGVNYIPIRTVGEVFGYEVEFKDGVVVMRR